MLAIHGHRLRGEPSYDKEKKTSDPNSRCRALYRAIRLHEEIVTSYIEMLKQGTGLKSIDELRGCMEDRTT